jgi:hypothetical protein
MDRFITCWFFFALCLDRYNSLTGTSVTIAADIISVALIFSGSIPEALVSTYFTLASAMACRIFRATLLGIIEDPQPNTAQIESFYRSANQSDSQNIAEKHNKTYPSSKLDIGVTAQTMKFNDGYSLWGRFTGHMMRRDFSQHV